MACSPYVDGQNRVRGSRSGRRPIQPSIMVLSGCKVFVHLEIRLMLILSSLTAEPKLLSARVPTESRSFRSGCDSLRTSTRV